MKSIFDGSKFLLLETEENLLRPFFEHLPSYRPTSLVLNQLAEKEKGKYRLTPIERFYLLCIAIDYIKQKDMNQVDSYLSCDVYSFLEKHILTRNAELDPEIVETETLTVLSTMRYFILHNDCVCCEQMLQAINKTLDCKLKDKADKLNETIAQLFDPEIGTIKGWIVAFVNRKAPLILTDALRKQLRSDPPLTPKKGGRSSRLTEDGANLNELFCEYGDDTESANQGRKRKKPTIQANESESRKTETYRCLAIDTKELKIAYNVLLIIGWVAPETDFASFKKVYSGEVCEAWISWKGSRPTLAGFINATQLYGVIDKQSALHKWDIATHHFTGTDKQMKNITVGLKNYKYKNLKKSTQRVCEILMNLVLPPDKRTMEEEEMGDFLNRLIQKAKSSQMDINLFE